MSGGNKTQTTTNTPWSEAIPYEKQVLKDAQTNYQTNPNPFTYYPKETVTPFSGQTQQALNMLQNQSTGYTDAAGTFHQPIGTQLATNAGSDAIGVLKDQGISDWERAALGQTNQTALGNNNITAANYLTPYARGDYLQGRSVTNADGSTSYIPPPSDPAFTRQLDYQAGQTADDINRGFSNSGRYGSASQFGLLGDSIGHMRDSAMADELGKQRALQVQAAGILGQQQGQNISNQMQAGQNIQGAQQGAYNTIANYSGLLPGLQQAQLQPATTLAQVGQAYDTQNQQRTQEAIDRYTTNAQANNANLANYAALAGGAGALGGTQTTTAPSASWLQGLLGGASGLGGLLGSLFG